MIISSFRCQLCGEHFSSSIALSRHWRESTCRVSGVHAESSKAGQVVTLSSEGQIVTVTGIPATSLQVPIEIIVTDVTTVAPHDEEDVGPSALGIVGHGEASDLLEEQSAGGSEEPSKSSRVSTDGDQVTAIEISAATTSETVSVSSVHLPHLLSQGVGLLSESAKGTNVVSLVTEDTRQDPTEESHSEGVIKQESLLSQMPATVQLPGDAFLGQVAMEIHIPMQTQEVVEETEKSNVIAEMENEVFFAAGPEDKAVDQRGEVVESEIHSKVMWQYEKQHKKREVHKRSGIISSKAKGVSKFCCEQCGKTYSKSSNLLRHKHIHSGQKFACDECDKVYAYKETLKAHKAYYHREPIFEGLHRCKYCPELFESKAQRSIHVRTHVYDKPFSCVNCQKTFSTQVSLKKHQMNHTAVRAFQCDVCGKTFRRNTGLRRHRLVHTCSVDKHFKCQNCEKSFVDKSSLKSHEKTQHKTWTFACHFCPKRFKALSVMRVHAKIHTRAKTHACSKCTLKFGTPLELKMHNRNHWKEEQKENVTLEENQCKVCGDKFTHKSSLCAHERTHSGEMPYQCTTCQRRFTYYSTWRRHVQKHKGETSFNCGKCGKGYTKKMYLLRHKSSPCHGPKSHPQEGGQDRTKESTPDVVDAMKQQVGKSKTIMARTEPCSNSILDRNETVFRDNNAPHASEQGESSDTQGTAISSSPIHIKMKPFVCEQCGRMYQSKASLQRHLKSHQNKKPFQCPLCEKSYSRKPILEDHLIMVHAEGKTKNIYKCPECPQVYHNLQRLASHRKKHSEERPFKCQYCPKAFKEASNVKRHELIHLGKKPHKCVICGRGFSDRGNLQKHEATHGIKGKDSRTNVENWKPFSCGECGKSFKQLGYLRYHERMHRKIEVFSCTLCDKTFSQAANLKTHVKSHSEKAFKCDQCSLSYRKESKLQQHKASCHAVKRCFVCGKCGKVLSSKANLVRHENKHLGLKPFQCPLCEVAFSERLSLRKHIKAHQDDVFFCKKCDSIFTSEGALDEHEKNHMCSGIHKCQSCDRTFSSKNGLSRHKQSHGVIRERQRSSEKSSNVKRRKLYICDVCNKQFDKKKLLSKHKKGHRKERKNN